jgi:tetratricopeptide (TPR) repeat protein
LWGVGQTLSHDSALLSVVRDLYAQERWEDIARMISSSNTSSAELDYYHGMALARLRRWEEARAAFSAGQEKEPQDERFSLELAGVAFKQKDFSRAKRHLGRALELEPVDLYANNFLATLYLLDRNLEAALKYWNRVGKPQIEEIKVEPPPKVNPVVLDRAFLLAPASILEEEALLATKARLDQLNVFSRYQFELLPRDDQKFDLRLRVYPRTGIGDGRLNTLVSIFREAPYKTVHFDFYNVNRSGLHLRSSYRWDAHKRRLFSDLTAPLGGNPKWGYRLYLDARDEQWDISETFRAPLTDLSVEKVEAGAELKSVPSGRWRWETGIAWSHRNLQPLDSTLADSSLFADGSLLKFTAAAEFEFLRIPEKRISLTSTISAHLGRFFEEPLDRFFRIQASLDLEWFPQARGKDNQMHLVARVGKTSGDIPFDELFSLGLERDNDLWLRAHIGTKDGRKGNSPLGRDYILLNWDWMKAVYEGEFYEIAVGPFVDTGKTYDSSGNFGALEWFWDTGIEVRLTFFRIFGFVLSYGKDLRSGKNAFYTRAIQ